VVLVLLSLVALGRGRAGQGDSAVYLVGRESRLEAHVGKAGVLGFAGHEHLVRARAVRGRVVYRPTTPGGSRVEIIVRADSLEVLTPPDPTERRRVTAVMQAEVLAVSEHREITFVSQRVIPTIGGYRVQGVLTLAGVSRDVATDVAVRITEDSLRASGTFSVKQTDFGIKLVQAGAGTVRVADRVTITFAVDAARLTLP